MVIVFTQNSTILNYWKPYNSNVLFLCLLMCTHGRLLSCVFCNYVSRAHVQQVFICRNPERSRLRGHPIIPVLCLLLPGHSENSSFYKNFVAWGFPNNVDKIKFNGKQAQVHGRHFFLLF